MDIQRVVLRVLLASIVVSAALGCLAVFQDGPGDDFQIKLLITSLTLSGACALILASLAASAMAGSRVRVVAGVSGSLAALPLIVFGAWIEMRAEAWWQVTLTFVLLAAWGAYGSMIALAKLAPRYQWARFCALCFSLLLALVLFGLLWEIVDDGNGTERVVALLSILLTAATLAVVGLHWMSRNESRPREGAVVHFCPGCGRRVWQPAGEIRCDHCDGRFLVEPRPSGGVPPAVLAVERSRPDK